MTMGSDELEHRIRADVLDDQGVEPVVKVIKRFFVAIS
jgi:hypothetical protein